MLHGRLLPCASTWIYLWREQTLAINTEHHNVHFELLSTLDMLPRSGENRELWFQRVHAYEVENEVKIEDMVATVQEMRRREAVHKKMAMKGIAMMMMK